MATLATKKTAYQEILKEIALGEMKIAKAFDKINAKDEFIIQYLKEVFDTQVKNIFFKIAGTKNYFKPTSLKIEIVPEKRIQLYGRSKVSSPRKIFAHIDCDYFSEAGGMTTKKYSFQTLTISKKAKEFLVNGASKVTSTEIVGLLKKANEEKINALKAQMKSLEQEILVLSGKKK